MNEDGKFNYEIYCNAYDKKWLMAGFIHLTDAMKFMNNYNEHTPESIKYTIVDNTA